MHDSLRYINIPTYLLTYFSYNFMIRMLYTDCYWFAYKLRSDNL